MPLTRILCPTDFSPGADSALTFAARLAAETGAELVVAHAWYIPATAYSLEAPFPGQVTQQLVDDVERALSAAVETARAAGAKRVTGTLLNGVPWAAIVTLLEERAFDLCVLGTHGRTGLARILLGSVAENVVRHAPSSVVVVRPGAGWKPFAHVLVPTDFSGCSLPARELATQLVAPQGRITLMHVIEVPFASAKDIPFMDFARDLEAHVAAALEKAAGELRASTTVPIATASRIGHAGAEILATLDADPTIDLVVMGSHGRTGLARVLLGSVAEKTVRHAACPVVVARRRA